MYEGKIFNVANIILLGMIYQVSLLTDQNEIQRLYEFIKQYPLDYPDYFAWLEKCYRELQMGNKKAVVCVNNERIIANLIFQQHKRDPKSLELKNGRVDERLRRQKIFTRLYEVVEQYARENGFLRIVADTHTDNQPVIATFEDLGFVIEAEGNLYRKDKLEVILSKLLK